jgi:hypothetical protein
MNPLIQFKNTTLLPVFIPLTLVCFALSPSARAVCQEGCNLSNNNTFLGNDALILNTAGTANTAIGAFTLDSNTAGSNNTATGSYALLSNTTGSYNTAVGYIALEINTTGIGNTAVGFQTLVANTNGSDNTANGESALFFNTEGNFNTANGSTALYLNTTGNGNTGIGVDALLRNTTGNNNIALGFEAGVNLTTGNFNIDIGNFGVVADSKTIRIGTTGTHRHTAIAGISGATVPSGVGVIIDTNGHLGTVVSSERFKHKIKPMDKASEAIFALKPVTFRYKQELDPDGIPQFGLVAEQVEKVNPDLVARDNEGKAYTVRYEAVNAMLLNEFLKEHRIVQELKSTVAKQEAIIAKQQNGFESNIARQQKQIQALTAGLEKVSAQLEVSKPAPPVVNNP